MLLDDIHTGFLFQLEKSPDTLWFSTLDLDMFPAISELYLRVNLLMQFELAHKMSEDVWANEMEFGYCKKGIRGGEKLVYDIQEDVLYLCEYRGRLLEGEVKRKGVPVLVFE